MPHKYDQYVCALWVCPLKSKFINQSIIRTISISSNRISTKTTSSFIHLLRFAKPLDSPHAIPAAASAIIQSAIDDI